RRRRSSRGQRQPPRQWPWCCARPVRCVAGSVRDSRPGTYRRTRRLTTAPRTGRRTRRLTTAVGPAAAAAYLARMLTGVFFLCAALGLVAAGVWKVQRIEQQSTDAIKAEATRLGWGFQAEVQYDAIPRLDRFELFDRGRSWKLRNLLTSPAG